MDAGGGAASEPVRGISPGVMGRHGAGSYTGGIDMPLPLFLNTLVECHDEESARDGVAGVLAICEKLRLYCSTPVFLLRVGLPRSPVRSDEWRAPSCCRLGMRVSCCIGIRPFCRVRL